ncbi:MAG: PD40 domain-containing protein [Anaerolineae bacterium]|nr:PD40 domain-containing protein [Anaerolineae bacterium]
MRNKIFAITVIGILLLAACSSQPEPNSTIQRAPPQTPVNLVNPPVNTLELPGKFVFAPGDGSIWVQDPVKGQPQPIFTPSPETFGDAPHYSPDGNRIVFVRSSLTDEGRAKNEIYSVAADGSDSTVMASPPNARIAFNWPTYSPDGKWVYYTAVRPDPQKQQLSEIQRVPVTGGNAEIIIDDARAVDVSPDGSKIVFMRFNYETFTAGLWLADADGKNARELLNDQVFVTIAAPHFSPDGQTILFVASGPNTRPLPGVSFRTSPCEPQLLCFLAHSAYANGLPWDLWTVTTDGSKFTQLTKVGSDSPWPAWSRDGNQIAFFDTSGMYLLDVPSRVVTLINRNGGHGIFDWTQP